jgi:hypothetical protein
MIGDMNIPDVMNMSDAVKAVILEIGGVAVAAAGGYLGFLVIRKGLKHVLMCDGDREIDGVDLAYEQQRIRQGMEAAAYDHDYERLQEWGDRYEAIWGYEARREVEDEINAEHHIWKV